MMAASVCDVICTTPYMTVVSDHSVFYIGLDKQFV